ncbi:class I SAM-dependent methyltransferase [Alphaproteobacteria bacterium]|nr:class I SAM-dependent methyltransferase [Alphaproteobacteria bacterium]
MNKVNIKIKKILNNNKKLAKCLICNSKKISFFVNKYKWNMDRCLKCGLIFTNPYPSNDQINYYYSSEMKEFENNFFKETYNERTNLFLPRAKIIAKLLRNKGNLLDIGSGIGIFINSMNKISSKLHITACDINEEAIIEINSSFPQVNTLNCDLKDINEDVKYDCITLWDTFEHLVDPKILLKKASNLLKKNGYLILSTPNTLSLEWMVAGNEHVQILPPGHVNLYNTKNIEIILKKKFVIKEIYTLNGVLDVTYLEKFLSKKDDLLSLFWKELLKDKKNSNQIIKMISKSNFAGNMMVVCQKK